MPEADWDAVERLVAPIYEAVADPLNSAPRARRVARHAAHMSQGLEPFSQTRARLLALFSGLAPQAADTQCRRRWTRPLKEAGVPLDDQMWLWIALARFAQAPETHEECAVRDACVMETVGARGVAAALLAAGAAGGTIRSALEAARASVDAATLITPAGRRLGVRRIISARRFLKELEEE